MRTLTRRVAALEREMSKALAVARLSTIVEDNTRVLQARPRPRPTSKPASPVKGTVKGIGKGKGKGKTLWKGHWTFVLDE